MSSWTEQILAEAREIGPDDFIEVDHEVGEQDHPVGQAPILARQLWTLSQRFKKKGLELLLEFVPCESRHLRRVSALSRGRLLR